MRIKFKTTDDPLYAHWTPDPWVPSDLGIVASFQSTYTEPQTGIPGTGDPSILDPDSLFRLPPDPSSRIVTSVLDAEVLVQGVDVTEYVVSMDTMRPLNGETDARIELRASGTRTLDPEHQSYLRAGNTVSIQVQYAGVTVSLLQGYVVEPPKFRILDGNVGALTLRAGDLFLLKRQSENTALEAYCGQLPRTTATAAQIFARVRGLPGTWGGEALVENVSPDFVEGAPWDFLSQLYEPLDYDVRSTVSGDLVAVPRPKWNLDRAIVLDQNQCIEADLDSPAQLPFSIVPGYNKFDRDLGFRTRSTQETDYSNWDPTNTEPWFQSNNTYQVIKSRFLGDTLIGLVVETWGYLPDSTVVPSGAVPDGTVGPCGEYTPPPEVEPVTTQIKLLQTENTILYFEGHVSGNFVVTGQETTIEGWSQYTDTGGNTILYFGPLKAERRNYGHTAIETPGICPQYWPLFRVYAETTTWNRVNTNSPTEPTYQLTQTAREQWIRSTEQITEGQVLNWFKVSSSQSYDSSTGRWVGGDSPREDGTPPTATMIKALKVPVVLETEIRLPELVALFGERRSRPVQIPNAYTDRELVIATERFARETAGLAYSVHLLVDPRVPVLPGSLIRYQRDAETEIHGIAWSVETNISGFQATQSVVLMRTFTEPALIALRSSSEYVPDVTLDLEDPCS